MRSTVFERIAMLKGELEPGCSIIKGKRFEREPIDGCEW
jgi:hypothetical protein